MRKVLEDGFGWEKRIGIGKNTGGNGEDNETNQSIYLLAYL
jgi:hypothetical protein